MQKTNLWIQFLPLWVLVNVFGWATFDVALNLPFYNCGSIAGVGIAMALLQWKVLEPWTSLDWTWALASVPVYSGFYFFIYFLATPDFPFVILVLIQSAIFGLLGIFQWLVLRQYLYRAKAWLAASPLAGLIGIFLGLWTNFLAVSHTLSALLFWLVFGLVYGLVTGMVLVVLISAPSPQEGPEPK